MGMRRMMRGRFGAFRFFPNVGQLLAVALLCGRKRSPAHKPGGPRIPPSPQGLLLRKGL